MELTFLKFLMKVNSSKYIFRLSSRCPYNAQLWLYWRNVDNDEEADYEVRLIVATEGERAVDTNLEEKEGFTKMFSSDKLEFLDKSEVFVKVTGNLETCSDSAKLIFRPFLENRITIPIRRREPDSTPVGKIEIHNDTDVKLHSMPLLFKL